MDKPKKDRLVTQPTGAVEILKSTTVAIAQVELAPSMFPSITAILIGATSSYLFWSQGEADAYAPLLMGLGLSLLWRLRNPYWWNAISRWLYLLLFALLILFILRVFLGGSISTIIEYSSLILCI